MNEVNHRVFARSASPAQKHDPALIAATKYQRIYNDYLALVKVEGHLVESANLDQMHERWSYALGKALDTIPTTWPGVLALLDICTDSGSIGESVEELKAGISSIATGVRRLLSTEFKAA